MTVSVTAITTAFVYIPDTEEFNFLLRFPLLGAMYGMLTCAMVSVMSERIAGSKYPIILQIVHVLICAIVFPALIYAAYITTGVIPLFSVTIGCLVVILTVTTTFGA